MPKQQNTSKVTKAAPATTKVSPKAKEAQAKPPKKPRENKANKDALTTRAKVEAAVTSLTVLGAEKVVDKAWEKADPVLEDAFRVVGDHAADLLNVVTGPALGMLDHPLVQATLEALARAAGLSFMAVASPHAAQANGNLHERLEQMRDLLQRRARTEPVLDDLNGHLDELVVIHDRLDADGQIQFIDGVSTLIAEAYRSEMGGFERALRYLVLARNAEDNLRKHNPDAGANSTKRRKGKV